MRMSRFLAPALSLLTALPALSGEFSTIDAWTARWRRPAVAATRWENTSRYSDLLKAGQLYLSLGDAIQIAVENNLDIELQRYTILAAKKDTLRAQGGGVTRGLQYSIAEAPLGVGGPASPLLTSLTAQASSGSSVSTNPSELGVLGGAQSNLAILPAALSNGTALPAFDPSLNALLGFAHNSLPQLSPASNGTNNVVTSSTAANVALAQGFSSGASAALAFNNSRNTINSIQSNYSPYDASNLTLSVTQPLLRGFGRTLNRRYIRIAANQEKIASLLFKQQLISTVYGVTRLYIDLVTLREDMQVKERNLALAEWLQREVNSRVQEGVLPAIEVTRVRAGVLSARQDLINARALLEEQEAIFKNVVFRKGLDDAALRAARLLPTDALETPRGAGDLDTGRLIAQALVTRPELLQAGLQNENALISLEGSRDALRPQLDVVAYAQNSGLAGDRSIVAVNPDGSYLGGYGSALGQIARRNYPAYGASLQLNLPLRNRTAQADAARDEIAVKQAAIRVEQLRNQARLEVEDAVIALKRSQASFEAATEAAKLQLESLEAEKARFEEGLATSLNVAQVQSVYSQAQLTELSARGSFAKAKAILQRATGGMLEAYGLTPDAVTQSEAIR